MNLEFYLFLCMGWQSLQGRKYPFKKVLILREDERHRCVLHPQHLQEALLDLRLPLPFGFVSSLFQLEATFLGEVTDKNTLNMKGHE